MLELNLSEAIKLFVRTFYVVRRRHLDNFFSDWDSGNYEYEMRRLLQSHTLHELPDGMLSLFHPDKIHTPLPNYNDILRSLDMMTKMLTSTQVKWFGSCVFPMNLRFLTVADEMYDVTYLDERNWKLKYPLLPSAWRECIPDGQEDVFNHIAVVPSVDLAQRLRDLDFSKFVVIDHNGGILDVYDNE